MKTHMHEDRGNGIHDESEFWSIDNQLMADSDFSFSLNDTVPFGVKNIWKDNENHVQLMVLDAAPAKDSASVHHLENSHGMAARQTSRRYRQLHH